MDIDTGLLNLAVSVLRPQLAAFFTDSGAADALESKIADAYAAGLNDIGVIGGTILTLQGDEIVSSTITPGEFGGLAAALTMDLLRAQINEQD